MNCTSLPVKYPLYVLGYSETIAVGIVVKLSVVGAPIVDAWLLIICGCIDDLLGPVMLSVKENDEFSFHK